MSRLYALTVDLTGSNAGPQFQAVRHLLDGSNHEPNQLRRLTAEYYAIPVEQVSEPEATTAERFAAEEDEWAERLGLHVTDPEGLIT